MTEGVRTDKWYKNGKLRAHFAGKMRGYPGLQTTAKLIADYIPECEIYIEPFAGLGRVAKHVTAKKKVLNDKSPYAVHILHKRFDHAIITQVDFEVCMVKWNKPGNFFLIDPPWAFSMYDKNFEDNTDWDGVKIQTHVDRTPKEYYSDIIDELESLQCDWILCSNHSRKMPKTLLDEKLFEKVIISRHKIMQHHTKVKLLSNKPFIKKGQHQSEIIEY